MNPVRDIMSRFYRDHGLTDPEAPALQRSLGRTSTVGPGPETSPDEDDDEIRQLRKDIDDFTRESARQLQDFRAGLATQLQSLERVQQQSIRVKEATLEKDRARQGAELAKVEASIAQQERRLADQRQRVLQSMQERLQNVRREPAVAPPERVCRDPSSQAMTSVVIRSGQRQWAAKLVTWLENEQVAQRLATEPLAEEEHIRACPLLAACTPPQIRELIWVIKALPPHAWRSHADEFARVMA